jgi:hypothetical protein
MIDLIIIVGLIIIGFWVYQTHVRIETHDKLSQLAESIMWNTLLENKVISQETYDEALDRFNRNRPSALSSEKQKQAQIKALKVLLKDKESVEK